MIEIFPQNYCGDYHTIFNTTDGVYVCGYNQSGQLGLGDNINRNSPTKLNFDHEIISIFCGSHHTIFHTSHGLYVCGNNCSGQLGLPCAETSSAWRSLGDNDNNRNIPTKLDFDHETIIVTDSMKRFKTTKSARS